MPELLKPTSGPTKLIEQENNYPRVPKNLKMFIPIFKPFWTVHKIMEKLYHDLKNGKVEKYLDVY